MNTCVSYTTKGHRCEKVPTNGNSRCSLHHNTHQRHIQQCGALPPARCEVVVKNGRAKEWCPHPHLPGLSICAHHEHLFAVAQQREQARRLRLLRMLGGVYSFEERDLPWRQVIEEILEWDDLHPLSELAFDIAYRYFMRNTQLPTGHFYNYWEWIRDGRVGPDPTVEPPRVTRRTLAQLAADSQSVHTNEVVQQTNRALQVLLDASDKLPADYDFMSWLAGHWLACGIANWTNVKKTVDDIQIWYTKSTCVNPGDKLYKRAFNGLCSIIQETTDRERTFEMLKRAFEECYESVGMCCEGHMGRLSNVLVGFHEDVSPPVPVGELLQQKMGAISMLDVSTDEKLRQAMDVLNELHVPDNERAVWLDAFE